MKSTVVLQSLLCLLTICAIVKLDDLVMTSVVLKSKESEYCSQT